MFYSLFSEAKLFKTTPLDCNKTFFSLNIKQAVLCSIINKEQVCFIIFDTLQLDTIKIKSLLQIDALVRSWENSWRECYACTCG